jgi:DNA polymerase III epsilon subunit-like protein
MIDTRLVFIDTETTGLHAERRAWEIGLIVRDPGKPDVENILYVQTTDLDLEHAQEDALQIGGFYNRHPDLKPPSLRVATWSEHDALLVVEDITHGAHLVGAMTHFDAQTLANRMAPNGLTPSWHYHLIDIESMLLGYQAGNNYEVSVPWKSHTLSDLMGVPPTPKEDLHTAIGDARWVRDVWDSLVK